MTHPIKVSDFFVIRTPRLDFEQLTNWKGSDRKVLREYLRVWLELPETQEALYVASPSMLQRIDQWYSDPDSKRGIKMELVLAKYFIRMAGRATPFGLFSSVGLGKFSDETSLEFETGDEVIRKTRIDMLYLQAIKSQLVNNEWRQRKLSLIINSSIYKLGEEYRYIESYISKEDIHYRLSSIEASPYVDKIIENKNKFLSPQIIINSLKQYDESLEDSDVEEFIDQLVKENVLLPWLPLPVTGQIADAKFVETLNANHVADYSKIINDSLEKLTFIDQSFNNAIGQYENVFQALKALPVKIDENKLFQVDMYRSNDKMMLDKKSLQNLTDVIAKLSQLGNSKKNPLAKIIDTINTDYVGRMVPIKKLLDDEMGWSLTSDTGHAAPLLKDINLRKNRQFESSISLRPLDRLLIELMTNNESKRPKEIKITEDDINKYISGKGANLPVSFAATVEAYKDKEGNPVYFHRGSYGPSSANLLGRFCHLSDSLLEKTRESVEYEESLNPHAIYAEIAHLPAGRVGNVIARPCIRSHEIPFMTDSGVDEEFQISLDELFVFVENNIVKLWSNVRQCEIIPRLSSAHNYGARSLGIYTFLSMLQSQTTVAPIFNWPDFFASMSYLPRLSFGNVILAKRTWKIPRERFVELSKCSEADYSQNLAEIRSEFELPDWISFGASDNTLSLNFDNAIMLNVLLGETTKYTIITLEELLESEYQSLASQNGKQLRNEIIVPLYCDIKKNDTDLSKHIEQRKIDMSNKLLQQDSRDFAPGSEWLSIKVYAGNSSAEKFILGILNGFLTTAKAVGDISKYFFIRYADPDWHIRLRLNGDPKVLLGKIMPALYAVAESSIKDGPIKNIVIDTYSQEVERYGGKEAIKHAETVFWINSEISIRMLELVHPLADDYRWRAVLLGCDSLLNGLGFSLSDKLEVISKIRDGFGQEFGDNSDMRKKLGKKYRGQESKISTDFSSASTDPVILQLKALADEQASRLSDISNAYLQLEKDEKLSATRAEVLSAFLHMFNNRMFKAYGRQHEFVVYDMLRRFYETLSKRK